MTKFGFDARMINHSGIGTYSRELLKQFSQNLDLTLFGSLPLIAEYWTKKVLFESPIYSIREQILFPQLLRKNHIQVLHVPQYNAPLAFKGRLIVTVHDLIHLHHPQSKLAYFYARTMLQAVCRKADVVLTDSWYTQKDLVQTLGLAEKKIRVVYPGIGNPVQSDADATAPRPSHLDKPYVLYVGNVRELKNIRVLVDAFLIAKKKNPDLNLILVGKDFMPEYTSQFKAHPEIQFVGQVSRRSLAQLYRYAQLFVFPSLFEGFGLPPLEAMASGVPVICSNATSLPEVAGEAAVLFDPLNQQELADAMQQVLNNAQFQQELRQKGYQNIQRFSWQKCAQETAKVYEEVGGSLGRPSFLNNSKMDSGSSPE